MAMPACVHEGGHVNRQVCLDTHPHSHTNTVNIVPHCFPWPCSFPLPPSPHPSLPHPLPFTHWHHMLLPSPHCCPHSSSPHHSHPPSSTAHVLPHNAAGQ